MSGQNGHLSLLKKIGINLLRFVKYLTIYHFFKNRFYGNLVFYSTRVYETQVS